MPENDEPPASAEVHRLPVKFRKPLPAERSLVFPHEAGMTRPCDHPGPFVIDESRDTVTCGHCKAGLNPMWVLRQLCGCESDHTQLAQRYQEEAKRFAERSRTKCEYCGRTTRISRR